MDTRLKHEEVTGRIRQVAFETHRYFGDGFLEKVYENALARRLRKEGFQVGQQVPVIVMDEDGTPVGEYFADLLVDSFLIVEVKSVKSIENMHLAQLIHYLKATGHELGLLINFGARILQFKRVLYSPLPVTETPTLTVQPDHQESLPPKGP
jgi:GxxExxY protein